jgi:hypothetical protein
MKTQQVKKEPNDDVCFIDGIFIDEGYAFRHLDTKTGKTSLESLTVSCVCYNL